MINNYCKGAVIQIAKDFRPISHVVCKGPLEHGFLDIHLSIFSGASIYENTSAMRVILFWQMFKY